MPHCQLASCGKPLPDLVPGSRRKPKKFCDTRCRSMYHLMERRRKAQEALALLERAKTLIVDLSDRRRA